MEITSDTQTVVEVDADFLREVSSGDESAESIDSTALSGPSGAVDSTRPTGHTGGISILAGSLTTVNSLSARAVAGLIRYLVGQRRPPIGAVTVLGCDLGTIGKRETLKLRRRMGVVGGEFGLIPDLSVFQNLALPCLVRKLGHKQTQMRVERISDALQLGDLLAEPVSHLGAIERGVTLIARALTHDPELVVLEAPLSGLDEHWSAVIVEHFRRLSVTGSTALFFHEYTGAFGRGAQEASSRKAGTSDKNASAEGDSDESGFDRGAFGKNVSQS